MVQACLTREKLTSRLASAAFTRQNKLGLAIVLRCMNDLLFFPLAFTLALAIIASAALPGRDRTGCGSVSGAGSDYKKIEVEGDDLCRLNAAGQATLSQIDVEDHIVAMQIRAGAGLLGDRPDRNPHFRLAADLEQ